jgi:HAD superfamily hydrolase (TIGR01484 family)
MLATGRSEGGTRHVLDVLGFDTPAIVYNGGGLYCPEKRVFLEERLLAERTVRRVLEHARAEGLLAVAMRAGRKFALRPRNDDEQAAIRFLEELEILEGDELPAQSLMRVTVFSARHPDSAHLARQVEAAAAAPVYVTHFPLRALVLHRESPLSVCDVQPPCRGKAEALRVLTERYGIPPERVVAVGDADNDLPMITAAGLGVAMQNAFDEVLARADRVIGDNNGDAIGRLVEELFELG